MVEDKVKAEHHHNFFNDDVCGFHLVHVLVPYARATIVYHARGLIAKQDNCPNRGVQFVIFTVINRRSLFSTCSCGLRVAYIGILFYDCQCPEVLVSLVAYVMADRRRT